MSDNAVEPLYVLKDGLYECLKDVGAPKGPLSWKQIMRHMTSYVLARRLFDPKHPGIILCGKDKLGQLFEVEQFLAKDVIFHLPKNLWAVPAQLVCAQEATKRPATPNASDAEENLAKRARSEAASPAKVTSTTARPSTPLVFVIPKSPAYDSGAESELSVQGYETEYVKDSTDDPWYLESHDEASDAEQGAAVMAAMAAHLSRLVGTGDDDCPFEVEYEVESQSSVNGDAYSTDSDVVDCAPGDIVVCVEEDAGFFADSSDSSHSSDSEIGEEDLWECRLCATENTPFHRYCQKCWKQRFGWLPDRQERHPPQKRRRRKRKDKRGKADTGKRRTGSTASSSAPTSPDGGPSPPSSQTALDSQGLSEQCRSSQEDCTQTLTSQEAANASAAAEALSQELRDLLEAGPSSRSQEDPTQTVSQTLEDLCAMCMVRPKTGILVHGRTSHCFGCYKCSRKLLKQNKRCPICRRHIDRVTQHFVD